MADPGPRVLLVDDEAEVRVSLRAVLERAGIEVVGEAGDGAEGVALAWSVKPDVVLMDFNMPDMNGIQATEQIRETLPDTVVIFFSGQEEPILKTDAEIAGAFDFIPKGSPATVILERIRAAWAPETR
jgi:DNA-binding NarL/FixJ family response regulator